METLKSVVGLSKKTQEGQEPVSGVKGDGNAVEPYDAGNQEGAFQTIYLITSTLPACICADYPISLLEKCVSWHNIPKIHKLPYGTAALYACTPRLRSFRAGPRAE
jgi:hypothetical protein